MASEIEKLRREVERLTEENKQLQEQLHVKKTGDVRVSKGVWKKPNGSLYLRPE